MTKPDDILSLFREMSVQETPEAAATAALAWALRHAPVAGGALEISGHRIERIAHEPDPWPTHELIVASIGERREVLARNEGGGYESPITSAWKGGPTLTNVVPVTVVPVAELEAHRASIKALGYGTQGGTRGMPGSLLDTALRLLEATDALGVSND